MLTPINLTPNGHSARVTGARRINLNRPLAVGAAFALWAAILVGFKLLTI